MFSKCFLFVRFTKYRNFVLSYGQCHEKEYSLQDIKESLFQFSLKIWPLFGCKLIKHQTYDNYNMHKNEKCYANLNL